jgi:hypothetical protein
MVSDHESTQSGLTPEQVRRWRIRPRPLDWILIVCIGLTLWSVVLSYQASNNATHAAGNSKIAASQAGSAASQANRAIKELIRERHVRVVSTNKAICALLDAIPPHVNQRLDDARLSFKCGPYIPPGLVTRSGHTVTSEAGHRPSPRPTVTCSHSTSQEPRCP